jgi:hypothetical protein
MGGRVLGVGDLDPQLTHRFADRFQPWLHQRVREAVDHYTGVEEVRGS